MKAWDAVYHMWKALSIAEGRRMRLNDLISRQEAINKILEYFIEYHGGAFREDDQRALIEVFEKMQTVDAEPVRHGQWEYVDYGGFGNWHCSHCREICITNGDYDYCPNCGAKMDAERKEENESL